MAVFKDYYPELLELKNQGYNSIKIQKWLKKEKGVEFASRYIRRKFQEYGTPFNDKTVVQDVISDFNMPSDQPWGTAWLKTGEVSVKINNPENSVEPLDLKEVFKEVVDSISPVVIKPIKTSNKKALRAIISDAHVGMNPATDDAVFGFEYNQKIFKKHLNEVFIAIESEITLQGNFDIIVVDDLGDGLDGYNQETTRGGHKLPQNMSNKEAWRVYVNEKINTYSSIINLNAAKKYQFRNVSNCNHSGDFGYTANYAIKMALEKMYDNVEYIILEKHMEHFKYGDHTFLLAHGKDKTNMFKNMPLHLNDKTKNLIRQYIDHFGIATKYIHVDKGDLHMVGYDREPRFDYRNYMSFAPPSAWVQANFGVSYCGFSLQVIPKNSNQIKHTDIFFDLKKR
jgi:hypothetical protein